MPTKSPFTWKPTDIVEVTNASNENVLLELASGRLRLDAGRTLRLTANALEMPQLDRAGQPGQGQGAAVQAEKVKRQCPTPTLVLIDGHSLAFRAFHAIPLSLTSPSGELTNAVFGFTSMLLNVLRDQQPEYVAVAFDVGRTFRHEMYDAYKGHRERMPEELRTQVERIKEVVDALNIPIFTAEGYRGRRCAGDAGPPGGGAGRRLR